MKTIMNRLLIASLVAFGLSACSTGLFDKDNTPTPSPLAHFNPEVHLQNVWNKRVNDGVGEDNLRLVPAATDTMIFTADRTGRVTATDKVSGKTLWEKNAGIDISGATAAGDGIVVVGGRTGEVVALSQLDGHRVWTAATTSEILAAPTVQNGVTLVKAIDGNVAAYSSQTGKNIWNYQQVEPSLILRDSSAPQANFDSTIIGFANGNLIKLTLRGGNLIWQQTIAIPQGSFAIQRMVDIDADPLIYGKRVYAATYQGNIVALDLVSGQSIWTHEISSYTGLTADPNRVYVTDARSDVWGFNADTANVDWRQTALEARNITGPAAIGNYLVVGDAEGYLHWMSKQDGHFVARVKVNKSGIVATPIVSNNTLYVLTKDGHLSAYTLG